MNFKKNKLGYFIPTSFQKEQVSYPEQGNEDCYRMEENSQWFNARNGTILSCIKNFPFTGNFLDIGGGNGYQLRFLQRNYFKATNIKSALCEPGEQGCANAASRKVENVYNCTFQEFPFNDFKIGAVGLFDVLEHIDDDVEFLNKISDYLPKGSRIYITVPAMQTLWSNEDEYSGHFRRFNKKETLRLADNTGLKIVHQAYFFSYYVPLVWILRVLPEKLGKKLTFEEIRKKEENYHKSSSLLNAVLNGFHKLESITNSIGIKPFWGTSRFIVLEK